MAWIESHQELARHPKTMRLARKLGVSVPAAIGHLHLLWWWAMDYAQEGDLSAYDAEDLADAMLWEGSPDDILTALIQAGFLDNEDGKLVIHDWYDYAGRLIEKRAVDAERKRRSRRKEKTVLEMSNGHPGDGAGNLTIPNHTIPNLTVPEEKHTSAGADGPHVPGGTAESVSPGGAQMDSSGIGGQAPAEKPEVYTQEFEDFWKAYPRKIEKKAAYKAFKARLREGTSPKDLIQAAKVYAAYCQKQGIEARFIKHASTFLGPNMPFLDFVQGFPEELDSKSSVSAFNPSVRREIIPASMQKGYSAGELSEEQEKERQEKEKVTLRLLKALGEI